MKILFIVHRIPYPPNKGCKIRSFNEIKYLSQRHDIYLACLVDENRDLQYVEELKKYCCTVDAVLINKRWARIKALTLFFSKIPLSVSYFYSKKLKKIIDHKLSTVNFDIIFCFSSSMARYVMEVNNIPKVMDFVDVDSEKWIEYANYKRFLISWLYRVEGRRLSNYEAKIAETFNYSVFVSLKEVEVFNRLAPNVKNVTAITNGIDSEYFNPAYDNGGNKFESSTYKNTYQRFTIIFTGAMDYFANIDGVLYFYKEIFPLIKKQIPEAKFFIVGNSPSKEIQRLNDEPGVTVTGYVEDIRLYLSRATVSVVPLRIARGIQNKILEAMAIGIPVVATPQALEGIEAQPCRDLFVESEPDKFAEKVVKVIQDKKLQRIFSKCGRTLVVKRYNWKVNMRKLGKLLEDNVRQTSFSRLPVDTEKGEMGLGKI